VESALGLISSWVGKAHLILLDTHHPEVRGGSGLAFDWKIAAGYALSSFVDYTSSSLMIPVIHVHSSCFWCRVSQNLPIGFAGGLSPNNISSYVSSKCKRWTLTILS
jgi:phosphoribosylanthranilate isomerase